MMIAHNHDQDVRKIMTSIWGESVLKFIVFLIVPLLTGIVVWITSVNTRIQDMETKLLYMERGLTDYGNLAKLSEASRNMFRNEIHDRVSKLEFYQSVIEERISTLESSSHLPGKSDGPIPPFVRQRPFEIPRGKDPQ